MSFTIPTLSTMYAESKNAELCKKSETTSDTSKETSGSATETIGLHSNKQTTNPASQTVLDNNQAANEHISKNSKNQNDTKEPATKSECQTNNHASKDSASLNSTKEPSQTMKMFLCYTEYVDDCLVYVMEHINVVMNVVLILLLAFSAWFFTEYGVRLCWRPFIIIFIIALAGLIGITIVKLIEEWESIQQTNEKIVSFPDRFRKIANENKEDKENQAKC